MIHIVFEQQNIEVLKSAIELDPEMQGDLLFISEDYSIGPILHIYETEGYQARKAWQENLLLSQNAETHSSIDQDKLMVHQLIRMMNEDDQLKVWIWVGQNTVDVCAYYWLMSQLKEYHGRIEILFLNNLPFINEKGNIFYPTHLFEIQPKEFVKAKKLARPITLSEFEVDPDEWMKLCNENAMFRFLEGGKKIVSKDPSYFDKELLGLCSPVAQKLNKLISLAQNKLKLPISEWMVVYRIKELANEGKIQLVGDWNKGWREISVSNKAHLLGDENNSEGV